MTLPADILGWMEESAGPVTGATRIPGGGMREGWFVDAGGKQLFLRRSPGPLPQNTAFHRLGTEAEVVAALHRAGVRVPEVYAVHPTREAVLLERIAGDTWFYLIKDHDEQVRVAQDFIRSLARIHTLKPEELGIDALGPVRSAREHALERIEGIRSRATRADGSMDPLVRLSADWLEAHVPDYDGPVVLVQGDTGPGNFLYRDGRVTAVLDWELCHWGDPMDDIAWLSLRSVQDTFTYLPDRLREYGELSGHRLDEDRVWYYRVFAETTMATLNARDEDEAAGARDIGNAMIYEQLHRRLWLEALDHALGLGLTNVPEPPVDPSPVDRYYADVLGMLRTTADRIDDPLALRWTKGSARVIQYLREVSTYGPGLEAAELAEIGEVLGRPLDDPVQARSELDRAFREGVVSDAEYLGCLWRRVQREDFLKRTASGSLRRRTWPPLTEE